MNPSLSFFSFLSLSNSVEGQAEQKEMMINEGKKQVGRNNLSLGFPGNIEWREIDYLNNCPSEQTDRPGWLIM